MNKKRKDGSIQQIKRVVLGICYANERQVHERTLSLFRRLSLAAALSTQSRKI